MRTMRLTAVAIAMAVTIPVAAPAAATVVGPRDVLTQVAFGIHDKAAALAAIGSAAASAQAVLATAPGNHEALMTRAMAISYRAKLDRSRSDALIAKAQFEALAAQYPDDPEAQAAIGGWHLEAVDGLGGMVARAALGARRAAGFAAIDRAVALGGDRALFRGLAALLRLALNPHDATGAALAVQSAHGNAPTPLDRIVQHRAGEIADALKTEKPDQVQTLARRLLPLGEVAS